jgi:hypothetical protein
MNTNGSCNERKSEQQGACSARSVTVSRSALKKRYGLHEPASRHHLLATAPSALRFPFH